MFLLFSNLVFQRAGSAAPPRRRARCGRRGRRRRRRSPAAEVRVRGALGRRRREPRRDAEAALSERRRETRAATPRLLGVKSRVEVVATNSRAASTRKTCVCMLSQLGASFIFRGDLRTCKVPWAFRHSGGASRRGPGARLALRPSVAAGVSVFPVADAVRLRLWL